jgi:hypothetical protein
MRVLVTVSPRLYREAVASSLQNIRPGIEVRAAPPEDADLELAGWRPHLFIHNDTAPVPEWALEGVLSRVELSYSDGMNARLVAGGAEVGTLRDISTEELLRVVDVAARKRNTRRG